MFASFIWAIASFKRREKFALFQKAQESTAKHKKARESTRKHKKARKFGKKHRIFWSKTTGKKTICAKKKDETVFFRSLNFRGSKKNIFFQGKIGHLKGYLSVTLRMGYFHS